MLIERQKRECCGSKGSWQTVPDHGFSPEEFYKESGCVPGCPVRMGTGPEVNS